MSTSLLHIEKKNRKNNDEMEDHGLNSVDFVGFSYPLLYL